MVRETKYFCSSESETHHPTTPILQYSKNIPK
jgi:hypothetical protein